MSVRPTENDRTFAPRPDATERRPRRLLYVTIVIYFGLLGVGWRSPLGTGVGVVRYFHLPMLMVACIAPRRWALFERISGLCLLTMIYTGVLVTFSWYNTYPPVALQQGVYLGAAFMVAASLRQATEREWQILKWAGPVAVALFSIFFWIDSKAAGINPIGLYKTAINTRNLNLVQFGLFQQVFNANVANGIQNSTALRGQIFAGILVSIYLSMYARTIVRHQSRLFVVIFRLTTAVGAVYVVLSLARALQLAAVLALLLPFLRLVVRSRARPPVVLGVAAALLVIAIAAATPVAGFLKDRVAGQTVSYDERGGAFEHAIDSVARHPILGSGSGGDALALRTGDRTNLTAHNFVLDAAVVGGLVSGVLALGVVVLVGRDLARGFRRFLFDESAFAPLAAALLAPVVMFTSGGGTMQMPDLMGLAIFYAWLTREGAASLAPSDRVDPVPLPADPDAHRAGAWS